MDTKKTTTLFPVGLSSIEVRMLKSLCLLSGSRARTYAVAPDDQAAVADVWIVDARDVRAMDTVERLRAKRRLPVLLMTADGAPTKEPYVLRHPVARSRLLETLDALVARELAYVPEVVIGGRASAPELASEVGMMLSAAPKRSNYVALVVDDSATIRKQVELALRMHEVSAVCVDSSDGAIEALKNGAFDLIFLDVVLPGDVDGYRICRTIKHDRAHKDTPVVMLTGKSSPFDRVRGSLAGCDTYLTKPVEPATFKAVLKKYLRRVDIAPDSGIAASHPRTALRRS